MNFRFLLIACKKGSHKKTYGSKSNITSSFFFKKLAGFKFFVAIVEAVKKFLKIQNQKIQPTSKNDKRIENAISGFF